jgi:hypothetical protein
MADWRDWHKADGAPRTRAKKPATEAYAPSPTLDWVSIGDSMFEVIRRRGRGWINLDNHGFRSKPNNGANALDHLCITHIRNDVLCLRYLEIDPDCFEWDDATESRTRHFLGAAPARGRFLDTAYSCESIRIPFSGELLLAANFVGRPESHTVPMICLTYREQSVHKIQELLERAPGILHPAYDYREVLEMVVVNGTVIETRNLTIDMETLRCCTDAYSMDEFPALERWLDKNDPEVKANPVESSFGLPDYELWVRNNLPPLDTTKNESRSTKKLIDAVFGGREAR